MLFVKIGWWVGREEKEEGLSVFHFYPGGFEWVGGWVGG